MVGKIAMFTDIAADLKKVLGQKTGESGFIALSCYQ